MAYYYIKLYHEILNDYKMCTLSDTLWRRAVEFFLLAGEYGQKGILPPLDQICFVLRQDEKALSEQIDKLIAVRILSRTEQGVLYVTNFEKRQAKVSDAERKRRQRERDRNQAEGGHKAVTGRDGERDTVKLKLNKDNNTEIDSIIVRLRSVYEQNIGPMVPMVLEELRVIARTYPESWFEEAVKIAVEKESRNLGYIKGILKNWKANGRGGKGKKKETDWAEQARKYGTE